MFVNIQNNLFAGRTGSRNNVGKPQPRWADGISLAKDILDERDTAHESRKVISIVTRIREAIQNIKSRPTVSLFDTDNQSASSSSLVSSIVNLQFGYGDDTPRSQ